ncbi:hypothetical protein [Nitrososphaera sp. AFS]|uniref:hypothetical protein n=1 Tax=Nitrososphaera sp. AFS TaxID=2301191 RepID=UPI0013923F11|nr:hypothetical protein [Nitrososphaera sp. AFS]NAL78268.1 hypothetical protein [Nitrososphaera sp. AFS]
MPNEIRFQELINEISELKQLDWRNPKCEAWVSKVLRFLKTEFGENSDYYKEFYDISHPPLFITAGTPDHVFQKKYLSNLEKCRVNLQIFLEEIKEQNKQIVSPMKKVSDTERSMEVVLEPIFGAPKYSINERLAFVLMPIGVDLDRIYENIIETTIKSKGLECRRADDYKTNRAIMQDIWKAICESRVVVADITGLNPNVMYELGISHTVGKPTIIIYQRKEKNKIKFPFDLSHIRRIEYENTATGGKILEQDLSSTLDFVLSEPIANQNPKSIEFGVETDMRILPSLIAIFGGTNSTGGLTFNIRNIGKGIAQQIHVTISLKEKPSAGQVQKIQLLEPGEEKSYFVEAGYPTPKRGVDYKKINTYYLENQTTAIIILDYKNILGKNFHYEQALDVTAKI